MKYEIKVPALGESVTSGILVEWFKREGEWINEGDELFDLETDKATLSVPSPAAGTLHILVEEGNEVVVGQVVASLDSISQQETAFGEGAQISSGDTKASESVQVDTDQEKSLQPLSPAVRNLVAEHSIKPESVTGTGKEGRLTKGDILAAVDSKCTIAQSVPTPPPAGASIALPTTISTPTIHQEQQLDRQTKVKMTTIRRRTAERLVQAQHTAAFLTTFNEINMTQAMAFRKQYKDEFEKAHGVRLGFMSFFVKACTDALRAFPEVNAYIQDDEIVYNNYYDIGIAVSMDRGLVVPVIRNTDKLSFAEIEATIADYAERARNKRLTIDQLTGGTFSITNGGIFGSLFSTPIPNPPQTAILGMHAIQKRPVVINDEIVIAPMMYVALTYDHRIIDGKQAVSFLVRIKRGVENPERLLFGL